MTTKHIDDEEERAKNFKRLFPELLAVEAEDLFERFEAQAYSCYAGIEKPHEHDDRYRGKVLRIIPPGKLWPEQDDKPIPPLGEAAHDMLRAFILGEYFPCIGGRAAFTEGTYRMGFYKQLAHITSVAAMGRDLKRFIGEYKQLGEYTTFVAIFKKPQNTSEEHFEKLLWQHLQMLHDHDGEEWDSHYSPDPQDSNFAFSFHGEAFFVLGMHPGASRYSRRFGYVTLFFNPESQIRGLKEHGMLERFATAIRKADMAFQGTVNPSLPHDGSTTGGEARVYSGKAHPPETEFKCPFHAKLAVLKKFGKAATGLLKSGD